MNKFSINVMIACLQIAILCYDDSDELTADGSILFNNESMKIILVAQ